MGDDYDGETIDDIDPDEVGFSVGGGQVTIQDGNDLVVYVGDDECHRCPRDSVGVVVAQLEDGECIHHPVCETHLTRMQESDETLDFEVRSYE